VFGLQRFKLHRHLVDGTVKSVWIRQVFSLLRVQLQRHLADRTVKIVWIRQVFGLLRVHLDSFHCIFVLNELVSE
jgi:hypothetical protein